MKNNLSKNLKGTWLQAIVSFSFPLLLVFCIRCLIVAPFVIPSGSMIPNLLVHDHIVVKKFHYGVRWPYSDRWMIKLNKPLRGDIVVFRFPENHEVFYVKRLIGLPGDQIQIQAGRISVNGVVAELTESDVKGEKDYFYFMENLDKSKHLVRFYEPVAGGEIHTYRVPEGKYFFMGDNRDESSDSRVWGFADESLLVGKAWAIWLSCENTLPSMTFVCDPGQMRWNRVFSILN